jgi:hypothetical protein
MSDQADDSANDVDGWPLPSRDVARELDPPALVWSDPEPAVSWPLGPTDTG